MKRKKTEITIDILDNKQVIRALKSGNECAFDAVYRFYFGRLSAFGMQYISSQDEVDEVIQDTMMWLWENRHTLLEELSLRSLLFTIVKNKLLNRLVHTDVRGRVVGEIEQKYTAIFEDPDTLLQSRELIATYQKAMATMPAEHRRAFEMNRNQQLTHKEIAQRLGVSHQTVNYRISQALKWLRTHLREYIPLLLLLF